MTADRLERRARAAYERARLRNAAPWGLAALPLLGISWSTSPTPGINLAVAVALAALLVGLRWRGLGWARSVPTGLGIALIPLLVPTFVRARGPSCGGGTCVEDCLLACVAASLGAGALLGAHLATGKAKVGVDFAVGAAGVGVLGGALGCTVGGFAGVGVLVGVLAASAAGGVAVRRRLANA